MSKELVITGSLTDSERNSLLQAITEIETSLPFNTVDLSPQDILRLAKAGPATATFVTDSLELASRNPELVPSNITPEQLQNQLTLIRNLEAVTVVVNKFQEKLTNSTKVAKANAYEIARIVYLLIKQKKSAGLRDGRDRLAQRFKRQGRRKANESTDVELN